MKPDILDIFLEYIFSLLIGWEQDVPILISLTIMILVLMWVIIKTVNMTNKETNKEIFDDSELRRDTTTNAQMARDATVENWRERQSYNYGGFSVEKFL
jgi:hypothetical protein